MRNNFTYQIINKEDFINKMIFYTKKYKYSCLLDSNFSQGKFPERYFQYDAIFAFDSTKMLKSSNDSFDKLKCFHKEENDWLFGCLSYDLKNEIYDLRSENADNFCIENIVFFVPKYVFLLKDNILTIETFDNKDKIDCIYKEIMNTEIDKKKVNSLSLERRETKESYLNKVRRIKEHIQRGDIYEMNFCQEFYNELADISSPKLFYNLNKTTRSPFSSFLNIDNISVIGCSPERYLYKKKNKIISQPIKGTSRRSHDSKKDSELFYDLLKDQKELSENIMIVDLVRNDLSVTAQDSSVNVDVLCGVYTFSNVHQMISTISSKVSDETNFTDVVKTTFPMGSMTGAPKFKALNLIEKYEESKRGLFSGSVGYVTPSGDFDFNVVIRSLLYDSSTKYLSLSVGGAITSKSIPMKEYEECLIKAKPTFDLLRFILDEE